MSLQPLAFWNPSQHPAAFQGGSVASALSHIRQPLHIVRDRASGHIGVGLDGHVTPTQFEAPEGSYDLLATLPALYPEWLGGRAFQEVHGTRFAYVAGAMANGIATPELVVAMARAGMLGFYGSAGLAFPVVQKGLDRIEELLSDAPHLPWGANLIHSPNEPDLEEHVAELFIQRNVAKVSASAYMKLTPAIVRYALSGVRVLADGSVHRPRHVFAKISRPEVAFQFMRPAPKALLDTLVERGHLTHEEARIGATIPVAQDITVESDSGGHTDNRPLGALFPVIQAARDICVAEHGHPIRLGAAGGLGAPSAVASAFALGADYIITGSVNQAAVESGLSKQGRDMLALASLADVTMAPAADMFELGVELQVLKRGTLFAQRARKLYDVYRTFPSLDAIDPKTRTHLEKRVLSATLDDVWNKTHTFWAERDPREIDRANADPKHKMALAFRWYLGLSSRWAIAGTSERTMDYQIWCGPAMGAFNTWVQGSFLDPPEQRGAVQIALNLLEGAAHLTRAHQARTYGLDVPTQAWTFTPRPLG